MGKCSATLLIGYDINSPRVVSFGPAYLFTELHVYKHLCTLVT